MKYDKSKKAIMLIVLFCTLLSNSNATIQTMIDPSNGRTVYIDGAVKIDGCDAGLVRFEIGYVCKSLIPPPPLPRPDPEPIYVPPADAVCLAEYLRPEFESCPSGYLTTNKGMHDGDTWCVPTAAQITLCTPIYPPQEPDPGPGHDFGKQIGYMGPDGQLHETKDPNSPPCSGCKNGGETDGVSDNQTESPVSPESPESPSDGDNSN